MNAIETMDVTLRVWRQKGPDQPGRFETYEAKGVTPDMSFFEALDMVNEGLVANGQDPIAFDHDCREGICGMCCLTVDGQPHGPDQGATGCQLHMRTYKNGDTITLEPFRARAFPVIKDLVIDRAALDRVMAAGGFISVATGGAGEANAILVPKPKAEAAMDAAACIGCGACVAACPNASAMLFVSAKISQFALLPQGQPERDRDDGDEGEHALLEAGARVELRREILQQILERFLRIPGFFSHGRIVSYGDPPSLRSRAGAELLHDRLDQVHRQREEKGRVLLAAQGLGGLQEA